MDQIRISELYARLKPFILDAISIVGGGGGPYAPSPHDLSSGHHTGSLSDAQGPQFLKTDGSRSLVGNLTVAEGITIDGVDISVFKAAYDTHASLSAATAHGSVGLHTHENNPQGGQLDHGSGLAGLLDDDHPQYAHADGSGTRRAYEAQLLNKTITAGAGLTGGGLMIADRTLNVGAGFGITVNADDIAVNTAAAFTWSNAHTFQGLTLTRHLHPELSDTYDLGSSTRLWRKGWLSELDTILFAQNTVTLVGGWLVVGKNEGAVDANVISTDTQINFGQAMTVGDFVLFRAALKVEYMSIGSLVSGTTYNVTRNLDGSGADNWPAGTPFAVLGQSGQGRIELNAFDTPRLQMVRQGATFNAQTELIRIGDLNGNWGYSAEKWGLAIGEYAAGLPNIVIDQDGVLRFSLHTTEVMRFGGGNADITGVLRLPGTSSAITIGSTPPTANNAGTGIWIDRTGLYSLASGVYQVKIDTVDGKLYAGGGLISVGSDAIRIYPPLEAQRAPIEQFSITPPGQNMSGSRSLYYGTNGLIQEDKELKSTNFNAFRSDRIIGIQSRWTMWSMASGTFIGDTPGARITLDYLSDSKSEVTLQTIPNAGTSSQIQLIAKATNLSDETSVIINPASGVVISAIGSIAKNDLYIQGTGTIRASTAISCRAFRTTNQSIANNTLTAMGLDSERWDDVPSGVTGMHDNVTNNSRLTCRVAGVYNITGNITWAANNTGRRDIAIRLNGTTFIAFTTHQALQDAAISTILNVSTHYKMIAGDYVELIVRQASGAALDATINANHSPEFMMTRIA